MDSNGTVAVVEYGTFVILSEESTGYRLYASGYDWSDPPGKRLLFTLFCLG